MTNLYLDCEFNGFGGQLISMALVSECGDEWYGVLPLPKAVNPWVADNVMPVMNTPEAPLRAERREQFNGRLCNWLRSFGDVTVYADWYTDLVHLFESFAGRDHGSSYCVPCRAVLLPNVPELEPYMPTPEDRRHNALSDARALMGWHKADQRGLFTEYFAHLKG